MGSGILQRGVKPTVQNNKLTYLMREEEELAVLHLKSQPRPRQFQARGL